MLKRIQYSLFGFLALGLAFVSCQGDSKPATKYTLTPFDNSYEFDDAAIQSWYYMDSTFSFILDSNSNYQLGVQTPDADSKMCANSAQGQHIHLIFNDEPYLAKYTSDFKLPKSGSYYMLAFLSRSYHESIKTGKAHVANQVYLNNGSLIEGQPIEGPMLFYSRPKGTYVGKEDTEKVMLDFYLVNAFLGKHMRVKADINGETHMIDEWKPFYIEGLEMGENEITLSLVDMEGKLIKAPHNPVTRKFTLKEDPAENIGG